MDRRTSSERPSKSETRLSHASWTRASSLRAIEVSEHEPVKLLSTCSDRTYTASTDTVQEIEEFIWNDHFVVPVCSTGGTAAGEFGVPQKIFTCPSGVRESEWAVLSKPDATPSEVARAVVHVICDLKKAIHEHAISKNVKGIVKKTNSEKPLKKRTAARKRLNIDIDHKGAVEEERETQNPPSSPEKVLPIFREETAPLPEENTKGFKGKINRIFKQILN